MTYEQIQQQDIRDELRRRVRVGEIPDPKRGKSRLRPPRGQGLFVNLMRAPGPTAQQDHQIA